MKAWRARAPKNSLSCKPQFFAGKVRERRAAFFLRVLRVSVMNFHSLPHAAVDPDDRTCGVARRAACEVERGADDFVGFTEALQSQRILHRFVVAPRAGDIGEKRTRCNAIHAHL